MPSLCENLDLVGFQKYSIKVVFSKVYYFEVTFIIGLFFGFFKRPALGIFEDFF